MSVDPKNVAVHHGNADVVVCNKPVLIHWIVASNLKSDDRHLKIYDGESTSAPLRLWIQVALSNCFAFFPPVPVYLSSGLYMDVETDDVHVTIGYEIVC